MYLIKEKEQLNSTVERMVIVAPYIARKCEPGQFMILRVEENGERVPLTIADYEREQQTITIIYQVVGHSTRLLSEKKAGDYLSDCVGPLGKATVCSPHHRRVLGIGGGVGTAPLYPQLKKLHEQGVEVDVILGGRTDAFVILEQDLAAWCHQVEVATNDGSRGIQGFVTDVLKAKLSQGVTYDEIIAIGPLPMMKAVVEITRGYEIPTSVSLNPIMIDGTGMCGGCRVSIYGETKFACVDGPDFDGFGVDFDELMIRQGFYKQQEAHACKLEQATALV